MVDTGFMVPDTKIGRFAANYSRSPDKKLVLIDDPDRSGFRKMPTFLSGGGGLVSTTTDYLRFAQMLANGGELDGSRVLGRKTVELMTHESPPRQRRAASVRGTRRVRRGRLRRAPASASPSPSASARPAHK